MMPETEVIRIKRLVENLKRESRRQNIWHIYSRVGLLGVIIKVILIILIPYKHLENFVNLIIV